MFVLDALDIRSRQPVRCLPCRARRTACVASRTSAAIPAGGRTVPPYPCALRDSTERTTALPAGNVVSSPSLAQCAALGRAGAAPPAPIHPGVTVTATGRPVAKPDRSASGRAGGAWRRPASCEIGNSLYIRPCQHLRIPIKSGLRAPGPRGSARRAAPPARRSLAPTSRTGSAIAPRRSAGRRVARLVNSATSVGGDPTARHLPRQLGKRCNLT